MTTPAKRKKEPLTPVQQAWVGKTVRQHSAPPGYQRNIGRCFTVADAVEEGESVLLQAEIGGWCPSSHVEIVGAVSFTSDDRDKTDIVLAVSRQDSARFSLNEPGMTVDSLIARFQEMIDWLRERGQVDIEVGID